MIQSALKDATRDAERAYQFCPSAYTYAAWCSLQKALNEIDQGGRFISAEPASEVNLQPGALARAYPMAGKLMRRI